MKGDMSSRFVVVVQLWIHAGEQAAFEAYEREAERLMARHGGRIDLAMRPAPGQGDAPFEVHVVSFPDRAAYDAYRSDPERLALAQARARAVRRTQTLEGVATGDYGVRS